MIKHDFEFSKLLSKMLSNFITASAEQLANAHVKNRVEYSNLNTELNRIEKEKKHEIKMLNTEKQRFRAKYYKAKFDNVEASEVKMYETHVPGFCFKRNGEHRVPQVPLPTQKVDFDHLQLLLFTNGEVDVEKVLCLHLLSSHESEHLSPPRIANAPHGVTKKDSPLEQLIERSQDFKIEAVASSVLPTYVLDVNKGVPSKKLGDERLAARLLVNEKLLELIKTVMTALEHSNPQKVQFLIELAEDPSSLKRIFRKSHIQDFVMMLKDHSLVNSCSSFILTQPHKIKANHLEIRTPSGALEDLVRFIRSNVLQFPTHKILEQETKNLFTIEEKPTAVKQNVDTRKVRSSKLKSDVVPILIVNETINELKEEEEEEEVEINRFRRQSKNFIANNIAAVASYKRPEGGEEDESLPKKVRRTSQDSRRSSSAGNNRRLRRDSRKISADSTSTGVGLERERRLSTASNRSSFTNEEVKVHSKQTTCAACMEKWKIPLPSPKVSNVIKVNESSIHSMENNNNNSALLTKPTNLQQRISTLIADEQFKLDSYDRKYSNASSNSSSLGSRSRRTSGTSQADAADYMDISIFNLERIRQEIRQKETKKKLEKFLGS